MGGDLGNYVSLYFASRITLMIISRPFRHDTPIFFNDFLLKRGSGSTAILLDLEIKVLLLARFTSTQARAGRFICTCISRSRISCRYNLRRHGLFWPVFQHRYQLIFVFDGRGPSRVIFNIAIPLFLLGNSST
jgi:hypothetical protein